jgi:broad specificity phosphatase PhoE
MKLTVLRHARSIFNETGVSDKDCGLSEYGKKQASKLSGNYDVIVCSMMKRCRETLSESNIVYANIFYTPICREFKKDICDYVEGEDETVPETEEELQARVENFKDYLSLIYFNRKILVISHGDFLNRLTGKAVNFENGQMVEVEILDENPQNEVLVNTVHAAPVVEVPAPVEVAPVEVAPVEVAPVEVAPVEAPAPVEVAPVEAPAPVEVAPVEAPAPVEAVVEAPAPVEAVVEAPAPEAPAEPVAETA